MSAPEAWTALAAELEPHLSPQWTRYANDHGAQGWIRLILLVDAHHQLLSPRVAEKVAMTFADLAGERQREREGWEAIRASAEEQRVALATRLVDSAEGLLEPDLMALFARSIEPRPPV